MVLLMNHITTSSDTPSKFENKVPSYLKSKLVYNHLQAPHKKRLLQTISSIFAATICNDFAMTDILLFLQTFYCILWFSNLLSTLTTRGLYWT